MKQQEIYSILSVQLSERAEQSEWSYAPLTDELKKLVAKRQYRYYPQGAYGPYVEFGDGTKLGVAHDGSQFLRVARNMTLACREDSEFVYISFVGKPTEEKEEKKQTKGK
jgi:hypothetical protein